MRNLVVRRLNAEDQPRVLDLYGEVWGEPYRSTVEAHWRWEFLENPCSPNNPQVWVAEVDGKIVGQWANLPATARWGGREATLAWAVDLMTHPRERGRGVLRALMETMLRDAVRDGVDLLLVFPNETSGPILARRGWVALRPIPVVAKPMRPGALLRRAARGDVRFDRLARAALRYGAKRRRPRGSPVQDLDLKVASAFPPQVDELWHRAGPDYPLVVRRDRAYLDWRFTRCPTKTYQIFLAWKAQDLVAYLVARTGADGLGYIVDLFGPANGTAVFASLTKEALRALQAAGVEAVVAKALHPIAVEGLEAAGMTPIPTASWENLCVHDPPGLGLKPGSARWWITRGDADTEMP